ncbi:MAG TPA: hypothetical protein PKI14_05095 [Fervidobacterium sp.]|nr:hypothetical protein [Fervidobacterium sp.]
MSNEVITLVTEEYLLQAIVGAEKACLVAAEGIQETMLEIELTAEFLKQTNYAVTHLKTTDVTVSLSEFRSIRHDLTHIVDALKRQYESIQRMNYFMKEKKKEAEKLREQLRVFRLNNKKGKILKFPQRG